MNTALWLPSVVLREMITGAGSWRSMGGDMTVIGGESAASSPELAQAVARPVHPRRMTFRLVVGALAVVLLLMAADWWQRNREMNNLLTRVEASEAAMNKANAGMERDFAPYKGKTVLTTEERNALRQGIQLTGNVGASEVITTGDAVEEVGVWPWHRSIAHARSRYLDHSRAWQKFLTGLAQDPGTVAAPQPEITGTFRSAEKAFHDAVPTHALYDINKRIEHIFKD